MALHDLQLTPHLARHPPTSGPADPVRPHGPSLRGAPPSGVGLSCVAPSLAKGESRPWRASIPVAEPARGGSILSTGSPDRVHLRRQRRAVSGSRHSTSCRKLLNVGMEREPGYTPKCADIPRGALPRPVDVHRWHALSSSNRLPRALSLGSAPVRTPQRAAVVDHALSNAAVVFDRLLQTAQRSACAMRSFGGPTNPSRPHTTGIAGPGLDQRVLAAYLASRIVDAPSPT